jgi:ribosomal protein S18 acetylase RimI-like enzyme
VAVSPTYEIEEARPQDARAIADIHLLSRRVAMPFLRRAHTDEETKAWFAGVVGDRPKAWWVARHAGRVVGYMRVDGDDLDHLYVLPDWQGRGVGRSLLTKAQELRPRRLMLWTFERNAAARAFYEAKGFRVVGRTDGQNEEKEPDIRYEWKGSS